MVGMRKPLVLLAASVAAVAITAPALSASKTVTLTSKLTGAKEVPGPGDSNGRGKAVVRLNKAKGTVCYVLTFKRIADAAAAHIHVGAAGVAGDVVVPLFGETVTRDRVKRCVQDVDPDLIAAIIASPKAYYVNVHNADFPGGAIRGQLRKAKR